ncbi:MAG: hypothetical protein DME35_03705 [Verrucomicrobia bacterium]|nr:MAG: hypothetical protein DME35_03705 [Verrucomicrobiota bacterium]
MEKPRSSTRHHTGRILASCLLFIAPAGANWAAEAVRISDADALRIGKKIWQNESNGTVAGLTAWNTGENFASLGIGHFIWYPQGVNGPFEESFPKFLAFAREHRVAIPGWVNQSPACPWNSRAEFSSAENSTQMRELRQFLSRTIDVQAQFMVARLQRSLAKMLDEAAPAERANIERQFGRVASTPHGCYALVDFVNFKGEGVLHTERYHGEGWGLLQVLEQMHGTENGAGAAREFSNSAAAMLRRRVQNSPPERHEARWLPGWLKRVHSYSENS